MNSLMRLSLLSPVVLVVAQSAWALSEDACRDRNGLAINSRECIEYRKANRGMSDMECYESAECRQQKKAAAQVRREREEQIKVAEQEEIERAEAARAKQAATSKAAGQAKCGDDYKKPRIGMTMDRVRQCVSMSFKEYGQTNTDQGIVTTYRAPGGYLHVIDGKVVQWGKF